MLDTDDIEDYYLAAEVLERVRQGRERVFSAQEVRQHLGLDDDEVSSDGN